MQGWNGVYRLARSRKSYHLAPYTMWLFVAIVGVRVEVDKERGVWGMRRECDRECFAFRAPEPGEHPGRHTGPFGTYWLRDHPKVTVAFKPCG